VEDPALPQLHPQWRTKIALRSALRATALRHQGPFRVLVCDRWSRSEALVSLARSRHKDGISVLKTPRHLETHSFVLKDAAGRRLPLAGPHMALEDLVPLLPCPASQAGTVKDKTSWTCAVAVRIPGRGTGRVVVRCTSAAWTGTSVSLVTKRVDGRAQRIITLSLHRGPLETFAQDGTTSLGLDE